MPHEFLDSLPIPQAPAGLYVHIPFCIRKCPYCDFYSVTDLSLTKRFIQALKEEMRIFSMRVAGVDTIYIGGGTPSILTPAEIGSVLDAALQRFDVFPQAEITLEVNPGTVSARSLSDYRSCGVNRINIGVQSFGDPHLRFLKRIHSAGDASAAMACARQAGFDNIGVDLIYGLPGQTAGTWRSDLQRCVELGPEHLSCYMLTFEKGTPLTKSLQQKRFKPLPEEQVAALFIQTVEWLGQNGYVQYEISNFARSAPGGVGVYRSRHNSKYWTFAPYLGFGPSAHSFLEPVRYWNRRSVREYIDCLDGGRLSLAGSEVLTAEQQVMEMIYLGLRTTQGISLDRFGHRFKLDFEAVFGGALTEFRDKGFVKIENNRCFLSPEGMLFLDGIVDRMVTAIPDDI